jgi:tetratricopeptide (TPR) repeat protein
VARDLSLIALLLVLASAPALAQSKRYPPELKDADRVAAQHSRFWESVLDPERKPYDDLVAEARHRLDEHTVDSRRLAIEKLDQAIKRLPKEPRAYSLRGEAHLELEHWAQCADDLAFVDAHALATAEPVTTERERQMMLLGICQGRAGRLADAERTLAHLVATAPHGDPWMRLGEVRIALGKLDEAADALQAALAAPDAQRGLVEWLLALAYDRARKPTESEEHASAAIRYDVSFGIIERPAYPWLRAGEREYMMGIAWRTPPSQGASGVPEVALAYFRHFLKIAPDSPWRRRAEEHVRELAGLDLPQTLTRDTVSTATIELPTILPIVRKAMPAMRACIAKRPTAVFEIVVTRAGPRTPDSAHDRPHYTVKKSGVTAARPTAMQLLDTSDDLAANACLVQAAERMALPAPKDLDTYYQFRFYVVGP